MPVTRGLVITLMVGAAKKMAGISAANSRCTSAKRACRVARSLVAVISQVLMPAATGRGRIAGFEVMINNPAISNLIRKNETNKIPSTIQTSRRAGMVTLDDYLYDLMKAGRIDRATAVDYAQDPRDLEARA